MGRHVDIAGHPTWVEEIGAGDETIVLLHGGMGNGDELLGAIGAPLAERYRVVAFDRRGHGRTADTDAPFLYTDMADETIGVLDEVVGGPAHLVGYSDGAIVAMLVSKARPDLVSRQVLIGANYHYGAVREFGMEPGSPLAQTMYDEYVERSPDGDEHFPIVLAKAFTLMSTEPTMTPDDLRDITTPTLVLAGDDDLIEHPHTVSLFEALPAGQLAIVPRASHALHLDVPDELARQILDFLAADATPTTAMPSRRA